MSAMDLLYLSQQDVVNVAPSVAESVDIVEWALRENGDDQIENPLSRAYIRNWEPAGITTEDSL